MCRRSDDEMLLAFEDRRLLQDALEADRRNGRLSGLGIAFSIDTLKLDAVQTLRMLPTLKEVK